MDTVAVTPETDGPPPKYRPLVVGNFGSEVDRSYECQACGALVVVKGQPLHDRFHERLDRLDNEVMFHD